MHSQNVMHRDLKPENILISLNNIDFNNDSIKIADFGTAKEIQQYKNEPLTDYICTRWYRAPECVLKSKSYDEKSDIWALGCIMAELYTLKPLFPGETQFDQINKIVKILGTPNYEDWPQGFRLMEDLNLKFPQCSKKNFFNLFFNISKEAIDFLEYIFQYNPLNRPSAKELLNHPYLKNNITMRMNSYRSQSREDNLMPLKEKILSNSSNNIPIPYNYKNFFYESNNININNKVFSPNFMYQKMKNNNINSSRFTNEDIFFNKKPNGRSKSSLIEEQMKNYTNKDDNNNYKFIREDRVKNNNINFSNYGNENKELNEISKILNPNIMNINNKYNNIYNYNNRNNNNYIPFKKDYNTTTNNPFSSIAEKEIIQNKPFLFNKYIDRQKETINNFDEFHNIMPKIRRNPNDNKNNLVYDNKNNIGNNYNPQGQYRSFFATRYNL